MEEITNYENVALIHRNRLLPENFHLHCRILVPRGFARAQRLGRR